MKINVLLAALLVGQIMYAPPASATPLKLNPNQEAQIHAGHNWVTKNSHGTTTSIEVIQWINASPQQCQTAFTQYDQYVDNDANRNAEMSSPNVREIKIVQTPTEQHPFTTVTYRAHYVIPDTPLHFSPNFSLNYTESADLEDGSFQTVWKLENGGTYIQDRHGQVQFEHYTREDQAGSLMMYQETITPRLTQFEAFFEKLYESHLQDFFSNSIIQTIQAVAHRAVYLNRTQH